MLEISKLRKLGVKKDEFPDPDVYFKVVDGKVDIESVREFFNESIELAEEAAKELDELRELTTYLFAVNKEKEQVLDAVNKHFIELAQESSLKVNQPKTKEDLLNSTADESPFKLKAPNIVKRYGSSIAVDDQGNIRINSPNELLIRKK